MPLQLPNLDDRRWTDLVEEGRALIPFYAPLWTDHNLHDPGITLLELFAWQTEMDIYQLDRISGSRQRKFLALVGIRMDPPAPATTVISVRIEQGGKTYPLPASLEFEGDDPQMQNTRFRTLYDVTVARGDLQKVEVRDRSGSHDLTEHWRRGDSFRIFGQDASPGAEFDLGFSDPLPVGKTVDLYFRFANPKAAESERRRVLDELTERERLCFENVDHFCETVEGFPVGEPERSTTGTVHGTRLATTNVALQWDVLVADRGEEKWRPLSKVRNEVHDGTSSFAFNGPVRVTTPFDMAPAAADRLYHLRCRFASGEYDSPPVLAGVVLNGFVAEQSVPAGVTKLAIAKGVAASGDPPKKGTTAGVDLRFNAEREISELSFVPGGTRGEFVILNYEPTTGDHVGSLTIEAVDVGVGSGLQKQRFALPNSPVDASSLRLLTLEDDGWHTWRVRADLDASKPGSADVLLDPTFGRIEFGDGKHGRVPKAGSRIFCAYRSTRAENGNLAGFRVTRLARSAHNHALLDETPDVWDALVGISNPYPAAGGAAAEDLAHAKGRAVQLMGSATRAITAGDFELLALRTPGIDLARVGIRSNLDPAVPCLNASGVITMMIVPASTADRPAPSSAMRRAVASYLERRRPIGTSIKVVGPRYVEVTVRARVFSKGGVDKPRLQREIVESLDRFFHPLTGGDDGTGWPFGRSVFRTEVMQVIHRFEGTDHVSELEISGGSGKPQCGNVCLPANGLIASGEHQIEIL